MVNTTEELSGVGVVVENVPWGQRRGEVVAWVAGWVVRAGVVAVSVPIVGMEVQAWLAYPLLLQCFMFLAGSVGVVMALRLMATNPCEVSKEDVLAAPPREAVTWTWCSYCRLLRPPGSIHCFLCHRCIADIHHHCVALWRCIGRKSLPAFIVMLGAVTCLMLVNLVMIKAAFSGAQGGVEECLIALPVLFLLCHSILSLGSQNMRGPIQVHPSSAFKVRAPHKLIGVAPFTFSFSGVPSRRYELLRMAFRPMAALRTLPKPKKVKQLLRCPNDKCRALANPFWATRDTDGKLACNMCEAAAPPSEDTRDTALNQVLLCGTDMHCLVRDGQPRARPRLVFVLDGSLPDVRTCIHRWAAAMHGLPDVEVLCHETQTCHLYSDGKAHEEAMAGRGSLGTLVDRAWTAVAARGGRVVFISGRERGVLKADVLDALVVAASQVTLNVVCVSRRGAGMNQLLQPLVLHHQAQNGGCTRLVERCRDVLKLVQSGVFLFRGVMAHGTVRWTPGVEVVQAAGRGVTACAQPHTDSFFMACVDPDRQLELSLRLDPEKVFSRRRLSDSQDSSVHFQLQMLYTNPDGKAALCVFNRMFSMDEGQHAR